VFINADVVIRTGVSTKSPDIFMQEIIVVIRFFNGTHRPDSCT
jgi:hypothetical protein